MSLGDIFPAIMTCRCLEVFRATIFCVAFHPKERENNHILLVGPEVLEDCVKHLGYKPKGISYSLLMSGRGSSSV